MHSAVRSFSRFLAVAGACALLAGGLASCTDDDTNPNLGLGRKPIWTAEDLGSRSLSGARLLGEVALVPGTALDGSGSLAAVDVRTGQPHWSADDGDPLLDGNGLVAQHDSTYDQRPPLVQELGGGERNVLVPYRTDADPTPWNSYEEQDPGPVGYGIAALDVRTGQLRWASEPMLNVAEDVRAGAPAIRAVVADRDTVLVAAGFEGESPSFTTWSLDGKTGERRWTRPDTWPSALAGGRAIVERVPASSGSWGSDGPDREHARVRALDPRDGSPVWDLDKRYTSSTVDVASGDHLMVRVTGQRAGTEPELGDYSTLLLHAGTGKVVERVGGYETCSGSERMIACQQGEDLRVIRTDPSADGGDDRSGGGEPSTERSTPFGDRLAWEVLGVFDETIVVEDRTGDKEQIRALDPTGKVIGDDLIGVPVTLSEKYAVFCVEEDELDCGMYATGKPSERGGDGSERPDVDRFAIGESLWGRQSGSWGTAATDMSQVNEVTLVGDAVLYQGRLRSDGLDASVVADAESGEVRWQLSSENSAVRVDGERIELITTAFALPAIAQSEGTQSEGARSGDGASAADWSALVPYTSEGAAGLAALSGEDGEAEWALPLGDPDDDVEVLDVRDGRAAVEITPDSGNARPVTAIVDLRKPKELGRLEGVANPRIAGDGVLVAQETSRASESGGGSAGGSGGGSGGDSGGGSGGWSLDAVEIADPGTERWSFQAGAGRHPRWSGSSTTW